MMARVTMLAMHRDGLITLPPPRWGRGWARPITFTQDTEPPLAPVPTTLDDVRPLSLQPVEIGKTREGKRWNEFIARYHYLGYRTLVGAQMRYAVHDRDGWPLAMLGFSTAARGSSPRADNFIGWTRQLREKNLPFVVDNPRFLILPWIKIPNLGSHILALIRRRLPDDWTERYNTTPVLIETFRPNPEIYRRRLQGLRLDPRRDHPGARALRPGQAVRQAEKGCLAPAPATWLRGLDLNQRPSGYEPDELPDCSTPRRFRSGSILRRDPCRRRRCRAARHLGRIRPLVG